MAKNVITIPATISKFTASPLGSRKKWKVAAYARVSTDRDEQLTSYEAQVDYTTPITSRDARTGSSLPCTLTKESQTVIQHTEVVLILWWRTLWQEKSI